MGYSALPTGTRAADRQKLKFVLKTLVKNSINIKDILDLGAGTGWLADALRKEGYQVTTFDKNDLAYSTKSYENKLGVNFLLSSSESLKGDFLKYKFKKKYDVIIALEFMEHGFFTEKIIEIMKEGGILIASFPNPKLDGLMRFLSWNGIWNGEYKEHYLEHINLFEPEEIPLKLLEKKSILKICYLACWKKEGLIKND